MQMFLISDNVDTRAGMRLVGVDAVVVHEKAEFIKALNNAMANPKNGIILITAKLVALAPDLIKDIKLNRAQPLLVEIPDRHGYGKPPEYITEYVRKAIGLKI